MSSKGKGKGNKKKGGAAKRGGAAAASNAPQQQQPEVTFEEALDAVEMMLEQSDLHSAEEALRHPALLGSLKPSDIQPVHAHLVPAMEIKAQVLIGRQQTKLAFQISAHAGHREEHVHRDVVFAVHFACRRMLTFSLVRFSCRRSRRSPLAASLLHSAARWRIREVVSVQACTV